MENESSLVEVKALKDIPRYKQKNTRYIGTRYIKKGDVLKMPRSDYRMYMSLGAVKEFELELVDE